MTCDELLNCLSDRRALVAMHHPDSASTISQCPHCLSGPTILYNGSQCYCCLLLPVLAGDRCARAFPFASFLTPPLKRVPVFLLYELAKNWGIGSSSGSGEFSKAPPAHRVASSAVAVASTGAGVLVLDEHEY